MKNNECVKHYAERFNYKEIMYPVVTNKKVYLKEVNEGFIVIESLSESKYVNFYLNDETKTFKKSDLMICALERIPAAWEAEYE